MEEVVAVAEETGGEIYYLHDVLSNDADDPSIPASGVKTHRRVRFWPVIDVGKAGF